MLTKTTVLKIFVFFVLILVFLNILLNIFRSDYELLTLKGVPKIVPNLLHSKDESEKKLNRIVISDYNLRIVLNKSFKNAFDSIDERKLNKNFENTYLKPVKYEMPNTTLVECMDPLTEGGPITPNATLESLDVIEDKLSPFLKSGGWYQPTHCKAKHRVAIIVPFRDRYAHLSIFLKNIHPFLMKQNIEYRIFVIEQTNGKLFNRAALMNIGYLEALKIFLWDCFIFHDVDLLPLDNRNLYTCPRLPRHMSVAIDTFGFRLPYKTIFGGVSAMTRDQFLTVNGFSNSFFGWGGEDDDMSNRLKHANLYIARYPVNIARYTMLSHQKERANPKRFENLINGANKFEMDGLNSIKYDIYSMKELPIFTWYLVELKIPDQRCKS